MPKEDGTGTTGAPGERRSESIEAWATLARLFWRALRWMLWPFHWATGWLRYLPLAIYLVPGLWAATENDARDWIWRTIAHNAGWILGVLFMISFLREVWAEIKDQEARARVREAQEVLRLAGKQSEIDAKQEQVDDKQRRIEALEVRMRETALLVMAHEGFRLEPGRSVADPTERGRFIIQDFVLELRHLEIVNQGERPATLSAMLLPADLGVEAIQKLMMREGRVQEPHPPMRTGSIHVEANATAKFYFRWNLNAEEGSAIRAQDLSRLRLRFRNRLRPKDPAVDLAVPGECELPM